MTIQRRQVNRKEDMRKRHDVSKVRIITIGCRLVVIGRIQHTQQLGNIGHVQRLNR